jgi:hypothetical protein
MGNIFANIYQEWVTLLETIGLAGVARSWSGLFFTLAIVAFAVAGAFRAIMRGVAGVRERQVPPD